MQTIPFPPPEAYGCCIFIVDLIMEEPSASSSRDALAGGLIGLLKPAVEELDERVSAVRYVSLSSTTSCTGCCSWGVLCFLLDFLLSPTYGGYR